MAKLSMLSLGPGDAGMVTRQALSLLKQCDVICVPTKEASGDFSSSLTHRIVQTLFCEEMFSRPLIPVYTPMKFRESDWDNQVDVLVKALEMYEHVTFVTLGDSGIYSTVYYILERLQMRYPSLYEQSEVVAGVTSFSYASAKLKKPLCVGDSGLEIIPLVGKDVPKTRVFMRPKIGFDTQELCLDKEFYWCENVGLDDEKFILTQQGIVRKYMTLMIDFFVRSDRVCS